MATFLSDKEIAPLIGSVLINAEASLLNPNGIALRLGERILFHSTEEQEQATLKDGQYLKVQPGESIIFSSMEKIDFSKEAVQKHFEGAMLMALITPTTTMMREGITQTATKIDAGFQGFLNWQLRNSSATDLIIGLGEPIFKLTIFKLEGGELPDMEYGKRERDMYQHSEGIAHSKRKIPASIPKSKMVASHFGKDYSTKQLKEAGYPFNHIGTELMELHGKFETVSTDVRALTEKIEAETKSLSARIDGIIPQMRALLIENMGGLVFAIISILGIGYPIFSSLSENVEKSSLNLLTFGGGIVALIIAIRIMKKGK